MGNWAGVLKHEGEMEAMMAARVDGNPNASRERLFDEFAKAHWALGNHAKAARYHERRVEMLGKVQRFRDQGDAMCQVANCLQSAKDVDGARKWLKKACYLAKENGYFSVECNASMLLGLQDLREERTPEGIEQLRYALTVTDFVEDKFTGIHLEVDIAGSICKALLRQTPHGDQTAVLAEVEPLVAQFEKATYKATDPARLQTYEFRRHDMTAHVMERRGDKAGAEKQLQIIAKLARNNPRVATAFMYSGGLWDPAYNMLEAMKAAGQF
mmetsp:Transcript_47592/g.112960  ORF Transcript_47592/g.112960 Transcript_47592/m.112960 type:complete len:270 (-) Transcript_47592:42-851(-)